MIDLARLKGKANQYSLTLSPLQLEQLQLYASLLVEWNQKINLTAITQPEEIEDKHFIDSLLLAAQPEIEGNLVDVGSGAGFPGLVAKIYQPALGVTLMEPTGKRVRFLQELSAQLGLSMEIAKERAEEAARKRWRESFTCATARAVASLPALCEYCLPLVKPGGVFIAMKGSDAEAELAKSHGALQKLGGKYRETRSFTLPDGSARALIVIEKVAATPAVYPRNGGRIAKTPLE